MKIEVWADEGKDFPALSRQGITPATLAMRKKTYLDEVRLQIFERLELRAGQTIILHIKWLEEQDVR